MNYLKLLNSINRSSNILKYSKLSSFLFSSRNSLSIQNKKNISFDFSIDRGGTFTDIYCEFYEKNN